MSMLNLFEIIENSDNNQLEIYLRKETEKININAKDLFGNTPLHLAASKDNLEAIKILIKYGANIDEIDDYIGISILFTAVYNNNFEMVKYLIENNANINLRDYEGRTPLISIAENGKSSCDYFKIIEYLILNEKIDVNIQANLGRTAIMYFILSNNIEAVKLLIERNDINLELKDNRGYTPLIYASKFGRLDIIKLLVEKNVNLNAQDNEGKTALIHSVQNRNAHNNREIFLYLANLKKINLNIRDNNNRTALDHIYYEGPQNLFPVLIDKGADLNFVCLKDFIEYNFINFNDHKFTFPYNEENIKKLKKLFSDPKTGNMFKESWDHIYNFQMYTIIKAIIKWSKSEELNLIIKKRLEYELENTEIDTFNDVVKIIKFDNVLNLTL